MIYAEEKEQKENEYIDWRLSDDWKITAQDESKRLKRVYFKWQLKTPKPPRHQSELTKHEKAKGQAMAILFIALWLLIMWYIITAKRDHKYRHRLIPGDDWEMRRKEARVNNSRPESPTRIC